MASIESTTPAAPLGPILITAAGLLVILGGLWSLTNYSYRPGPVLAPIDSVPEWDPPRHLADDRQILLLFYHPHCQCTVATVTELINLLAVQPHPLPITAYAFLPSNQSATWIETETTDRLRRLPGAEIHLDRDGQQARSSGVSTSGHLLLITPQGQVVFSGGLTRARGLIGPATPQAHLAALIGQDTAEPSHWPTFGCPLFSNQPLVKDQP